MDPAFVARGPVTGSALYRVDEFNPDRDLAALRDLWRNLPAWSEARHVWMHDQSAGVRTWVLFANTGEIVGSASLAERTVRIRNDVSQMGQTVDLVIAPGHRSLGPATQLLRAVSTACTASLSFSLAFPNRQAAAVHHRVGYSKAGAFERWVKPLSYEALLRDHLSTRIGSQLPTLLGRLADVLSKALTTERQHRLQPGAAIEIDPPFDQRFDRLWTAAAKHFDVIGDRSSNYLSWRFERFPGHPYGTFAIRNQEGQLDGYVIYSREGSRLTIADFLAASPQAWVVVMAAFLRWARSSGAEIVSCKYFGSGSVRAVLETLAFRPRGVDTSIFVHRGIPVLPLDFTRWHLTEADRDA